jgi:hypothetical protein
MLYCFLDTNIFLQFKTFDEIDWPKELGVDAVCLVVPKRVIKELDKHKHDPQSDRRRKRARVILKKIKQYADTENGFVRKNTTILTQTTMPARKWLEEHDYDVDDNDDCIIAAAHLFIQEHPDKSVILFNDDTGAYLKAKDNGIKVVEPSDNLSLPDEPDPLQKIYQEVRSELQQMKNAQPNLSLFVFKDDAVPENLVMPLGKKSVEFPSILEYAIDCDVSGLAEEDKDSLLRQEIKNLNEEANYVNHIRPLIDSSYRIAEYKQKVQDYLEEYKYYLEEVSNYEIKVCKMKKISFLLKNLGQKPADDLDIKIEFPLNVNISDDFPPRPEPPTKPSIPATFIERDLNLLLGNEFNLTSFPNFHKTFERETSFISVDESYRTIKGHNDNLKHGLDWRWSVVVEFNSEAIYPLTIPIKYHFNVANPSVMPVDGELILKVSKSQELSS